METDNTHSAYQQAQQLQGSALVEQGNPGAGTNTQAGNGMPALSSFDDVTWDRSKEVEEKVNKLKQRINLIDQLLGSFKTPEASENPKDEKSLGSKTESHEKSIIVPLTSETKRVITERDCKELSEKEKLLKEVEDPLRIADTCIQEKDFLGAVECFRKAAEFFRQAKLHYHGVICLEFSASFLRCKALDCRVRENYNEAIHFLEESSEIYKQLKNTEGVNRNLEDMIAVYEEFALYWLEKGDITKSAKCFESEAELLKTPKTKTRCFLKAAILFCQKRDEYIKIGEIEKVVECCGCAATFYNKVGMQEGEMSCLDSKAFFLWNMTTDCIKVKNLSKAAEHYCEVLEVYYRLGMPQKMAKCLDIAASLTNALQVTATSCVQKEEYESAANNYEKAAKIYNLLKDFEKERLCLTNAMELYEKVEAYEKAKACLKSIKELPAIQQPQQKSSVKHQVKKSAKSQGKPRGRK